MTRKAGRMIRTSKGLADAIFDEWDALNSGKSTPQNASAKARMAAVLIANARLEMDHARFISDVRGEHGRGILAAIPLGNKNSEG